MAPGPYGDTAINGYVSLPQSLSFDNFVERLEPVPDGKYFINTAIIPPPRALVLVRLVDARLLSCGSRSCLNLPLLVLFTAGNLLPPQVIIVPLYRIDSLLPLPRILSENGHWYEPYLGVILINVVFQSGLRDVRPQQLHADDQSGADGGRLWSTGRRSGRPTRKIILPLWPAGPGGAGRPSSSRFHLQHHFRQGTPRS